MSLTLTVDGERWRAPPARRRRGQPRARAGRQGQRLRLRRRPAGPRRSGSPTRARRRHPRGRHLRRARRTSPHRFDGDLLVLTPWRPFGAALEVDPALAPRWCTPSAGSRTSPALLAAAARRPVRARAAHHHAAPRPRRPRACGPPPRCSRDRPPAPGSRASPCTCRWPAAPTSPRCERLLNDVVAAELPADRRDDRLGQPPDRRRAGRACARRTPTSPSGRGSAPSCGSATAARSGSTATVLDVHPVERGDVFGYRSRTRAQGRPPPRGQRRHRARHRPGGAHRRRLASRPGPPPWPAAASTRSGFVRSPFSDRRQAAALRRAAAHAGLDAVPARTARGCRRSATRSTCGCASPRRRSTGSSSPERQRRSAQRGPDPAPAAAPGRARAPARRGPRAPPGTARRPPARTIATQ